MKYTVKKNNHFSSIPNKYFVNQVFGSAVFTEESKYLLNPVDQQDWNKLAGITYGLNPHQNTSLIGWRWNPALNLFQVAPYFNNRGSNVQPEQREILNIPAEQEFTFNIIKGAVNIYDSNLNTAKRVFKYCGIKTSFLSYRVQHYFGGNQAAPSDVSVIINWL